MDIFKAMHPQAHWAQADTPVSDVARMMETHDIGAVPIGQDDRLIGMLTDRDIVLRVVARGLNPDITTAQQAMTAGIIWCRTTEAVEDAIYVMTQKKIRRLPVIDDAKRFVGMLSLGDIAHSVSRDLSGEVIRAVSDHHA